MSRPCRHCGTIERNKRGDCLCRGAAWRETHREYTRRSDRLGNAANPERGRRRVKAWRNANPGAVAAASALRRARERQASPPWLTALQRVQINAFYEAARLLSIHTGVEHHVDHIVPLAGRDVCGWHVPWNLQILTAAANIEKGNRTLDGGVNGV